jgi:hypothetical protein
MIAKGRKAIGRGEKNGRAILTGEQVAEIRADPRPAPQIAAKYGVSASAIRAVRSCQAWKHLPKSNNDYTDRRGERHHNAKLTTQLVQEIRADRKLTQRALATKYSVTLGAINQILKRKTWTHVP